MNIINNKLKPPSLEKIQKSHNVSVRNILDKE